MSKLRHIAIATMDPDATARFFCEAFDFRELSRIDHPLGYAISLTDGTLNIVIARFKGVDQLGKGLDYVGVHHMGFLVENQAETSKKLEALGAKCVLSRPEDDKVEGFEVKHRGPDGMIFDVCDHPWPGSEPLPAKNGR
jgi:catechol 2,3-dioxygenase-like lactoylglutathione lyase family enzyme